MGFFIIMDNVFLLNFLIDFFFLWIILVKYWKWFVLVGILIDCVFWSGFLLFKVFIIVKCFWFFLIKLVIFNKRLFFVIILIFFYVWNVFWAVFIVWFIFVFVVFINFVNFLLLLGL